MGLESGVFSAALNDRPLLADRFEVLNVLGEGAAGCVYRVRDRQRGGAEVALKILADDLAFDEATLERFVQELTLCQSIRHPNIVEAYDFIKLEDTVAYTMEYVDGGSLQGIFAERRIGHDAIDKIFDQLLEAVQVLHDNGVVHRDIKLENVLIRTDGVVKLTDLGLMKQLDKKGFTKPGILLGTPQYMPPEYVRESIYDHRGDIYTLGLMLYELLVGKRWLSHLKGQEAIQYLLKIKFQISKASLAGIPNRYVAVLGRALEQKPQYRFQSALEMKEALHAADTSPAAQQLASPQSAVPVVAEIKGGLKIESYAARNKVASKRRSFMNAMISALVVGAIVGGAACYFLSR